MALIIIFWALVFVAIVLLSSTRGGRGFILGALLACVRHHDRRDR